MGTLGQSLVAAGLGDEDFIGSKSELLGQAIGKLTAAWDLRKFGELSSVSYSSVWDLSTQKSCAENIFQVNYIQGNADLGSVWNYMYGPEGAGVTSQRKGEMQNVTIQAVYDSFEPGDVRRSFLRATNKAGQTYYHTMKYADLECGCQRVWRQQLDCAALCRCGADAG